MPYGWNSVCYQDTATALDAFTRDVPSVSAAGINAFTAAPTIDASGLIVWSISNRPFSGDIVTTRTGTTQLLSCSTPQLDQWPIQSILFPLAVFFAMAMGVRVGLRV